jgi:hypothetical protein
VGGTARRCMALTRCVALPSDTSVALYAARFLIDRMRLAVHAARRQAATAVRRQAPQ